MTKRITICADDFGMSNNINQAIIKLLDKKIINATSCMVNMPEFKTGIDKLKKIYNNFINVGLHLNLTEGKSLTQSKSLTKNSLFLSLPKLLIKSQFRLISYNDAYTELKAQIEEFIKYWGDVPDFIDGHQHIHQFPAIRKALINLYQEFKMHNKKTYIRSTYNMQKTDLKSIIIYYSGAKQLQKLLIKNNIRHNTSFAGIYSLAKKKNFRRVIIHAYQNITDGGLIMCHPSIAIDTKDAISHSRVQEFRYFSSQQALQDQGEHYIFL
ncbi:MAG: ChbG/HpnK family deacetylase [Francisella sp.]